MSPVDKLNLDRAAFGGDARTMGRASSAITGIVAALRSDEVAECHITRSRLLTALELAAETLDERADYLRDEVMGSDEEFERLVDSTARKLKAGEGKS
ncbi:hypothetical protein [Halomonas smyrnensis]|uniref:hypothetical protein n=1 Tax=Halomonas smyrnensis TaxID=720605 RepID=UPI0002F618B9|nr:hypothetical protein [Halomonas smyrnensis]